MGAWGVGIFSNDTALDVREDFRDFIAEGLSAQHATTRLQQEYGVEGADVDDNDFWLGLAAVQHKLGHVVDGAIERALAIIDSPEELERWPIAERKRRTAALDRLREALTAPVPPPKRVRPRQKVDTRLAVGQHVVVSTGHDDRLLLRVTGIHEDRGGRCAQVVVVAWDGTEQALRQAHRLPPLLDPEALRTGEAMGFTLVGEPSDPLDLRVSPEKVGSSTPPMPWQSLTVCRWSQLSEVTAEKGARTAP